MCRPQGFEFRFLPKFEKCYEALAPTNQESVDEALARFNANPRHPSLRTEKIDKKRNIWSIRGTLSVRITFNWDGNTITLRAVAASHDIYKSP